MPFNFDPKDNDPRNTLGKKLKKVIVNSMFSGIDFFNINFKLQNFF